MIIHKYEAPWEIYGMHWSVKPDTKFRLALGSYMLEYNNKVQIISLANNSMMNSNYREFNIRCSFDHPYWVVYGRRNQAQRFGCSKVI